MRAQQAATAKSQINPELKPRNLHSRFTTNKNTHLFKHSMFLNKENQKCSSLHRVKISTRHLLQKSAGSRLAPKCSIHPPFPTLPPLSHFPQTLHLSLPPTLCPPFPPCRVISPGFYIFPLPPSISLCTEAISGGRKAIFLSTAQLHTGARTYTGSAPVHQTLWIEIHPQHTDFLI